jgi:hypothetical protein
VNTPGLTHTAVLNSLLRRNSGASGGHVFHASGPCDKLDICERER